jgi:hypothetical protein
MAIAETIAERHHDDSDVFAPLLDTYLALELQQARYARRALSGVQSLLDRPSLLTTIALYGGLSGLGFIVEHVSARLGKWIHDLEPHPCDEIDAALLRATRRRSNITDYDLIRGLAGVAVYALERLSHPSSRSQPAEALLATVVDRLRESADVAANGARWLRPPEWLSDTRRKAWPHGYYDLGVAHGAPALLVVIAEATARDLNGVLSRCLLDEAAKWILTQVDMWNSNLPAWIAPDGCLQRCQLGEAWCYGGLGLAVALLRAATTVRNESWEHTAISIAHYEAHVIGDRAAVRDACLCHGAAGNAHLYNRLYHSTREPAFLKAALKWLDVIFDEYALAGDTPNFRFWFSDGIQPADWRPNASYLNGSIGVALALLAAAGTHAPDWDRLLLADLPIRSIANKDARPLPRTD